MLNILQVSDLHRSEAAPVSNDVLLGSILSDIEKHPNQSPRIPKCDVIVVTGDLVTGAKIEDPNAPDTLKRQYAQAKDFLLRLCHELLDGDTSRLLMIPGNHDVSFSTSKNSMEKVVDSSQYDVFEVLRKPGSAYRWCWKELALYTIRNPQEYVQRLSAYKEFFDDFYHSLNFKFGLEDQEQTLNLVFNGGRALLTGFCSLHENDCFNRRGKISLDAVASNNKKVRESEWRSIPLKVALWHHSIEGFGYEDDHMNSSEVLPQLIDHGYALGLHGHQHRSEVVSYEYSLNPEQVMPIVACGSLCAAPYEIPAGYRRQYNMIEIDDVQATVRVHVREWFNNTIWIGPKLPEFGGKSYKDLQLPILGGFLAKLSRQPGTATGFAIEQAEIAIRNKDYRRVLSLLTNVPKDIPIVRRLLFESFQMLGSWRELVNLINTPTNPEELALVIDALSKLKEFSTAVNVLDKSSAEPDKYDRSLIERLRNRLDTERRIDKK